MKRAWQDFATNELNLMQVPSGRENEMKPVEIFVEKIYRN
jgi:hypothetical protein